MIMKMAVASSLTNVSKYDSIFSRGHLDTSLKEGRQTGGEFNVMIELWTYFDVDKVMWSNITCHRLLN